MQKYCVSYYPKLQVDNKLRVSACSTKLCFKFLLNYKTIFNFTSHMHIIFDFFFTSIQFL